MPKPGWGAIIQGEAFDLEDWADALHKPFDPWVEIHDEQAVLRSSSFDELTSAIQVRDRAVAFIERLNGVFAISHRAKPIHFGGVVKFTPDGKRHVNIFAQGVAEGRSKARAVSVVIGPDGKPAPQAPPQPSEAQHWSEIVERDDLLDDALMYFGKANWFDIYKALECLFIRARGEEAFLALGWEPSKRFYGSNGPPIGRDMQDANLIHLIFRCR